MDERLELLRRVPLFAGLAPDDLARIARTVEEIDVKPETVLTNEGRQEGYFFVIESGTVRIDVEGTTVNTMADGDFLGEIALLDGGPRTATATAITQSRLLKLTYPQFQQLLDSSPSIRAAVLEDVGRRLRELDPETVH
jgi:CRP-like cAMP-binding protein